MKVVAISKLREKLAEHMDRVCADRTPLLVTRPGAETVVMLPLAEYESLEETLHLLSDPANAEHLRRALAQAEAGEFVEHDIEE